MRLTTVILVLFCIVACSITCVWASQNLQGTLTVKIAEDRANLEIMYSVRNLTGSIVPPDPAEKYHYTIRNVATGEEVLMGNLDSAFQTNVSQYASPYAHAVFAVKRVPMPPAMKSNPGFYLIFLGAGPICDGEETVFYIPENLDNPNPIIREIRSIVSRILIAVSKGKALRN